MQVRKATMQDVEAVWQIVNRNADKGLMLPRSHNTIFESLRDFLVVTVDERVVATAALHIMWNDLAEIRAMAVDDQFQGKGIGRALLEAIEREAKILAIPRLFALTYQVEFFNHCGYQVVAKEGLPQKVWKECVYCPKFPTCDEIAVLKEIAV